VPTIVYRGPAGPAPMLAAMLRYQGLPVTMTDALGQPVKEHRGAGQEVPHTVVIYLLVKGGEVLAGEAVDAAVKSVVARFKARVRKGTAVEVVIKHDA
jgi:hypothetical protein